MNKLPLLPLRTVLFPGMLLPLHIFEERYKQMIGACLEDDSPFGVVLIRSGEEVGGPAEPYDVGTRARIASVQRLEDGRMNLLVTGEERFRIVRLHQQEPYLVGEVDEVRDVHEHTFELEGPSEQVLALFAEYFRLTTLMRGAWQRAIGLPRDPERLAYLVAARLQVPLPVKQELLEMTSARRRLEREAQLLSEAIPALTNLVQSAQRQRYTGFGALN
jgi:Lon protease-like protein